MSVARTQALSVALALAAGVIVGPTTATRADRPAADPDPAELVRRLGSPAFAEREAAERQLKALGAAALPAVYWFILISGAVISIGLSVFISTKTPRAHRLMAVAAAVLICTSLWLVLVLDYPLSGDTAFRPDAFERALYVISTLQNGQI